MIVRIVKLHFQEDKIADFLSFFDTVKHKINSCPGCGGMKLLQDIHCPSIVMTYSYWDNENSLNQYRNSEMFDVVWSTIKPWFSEKPQAWSLESYYDGFAENAATETKKR